MTDATASPGLPAWLDEIHGFLAGLRSAPFRIGVGEEARVLWLLDRLRLGDAVPQTPETLAQWLGPVCCTSARQQALFADRLASWAREHGGAATTAANTPGVAAVLPAPVAAVQRAALASRWLLLAGIATMVAVLLLVALWLLPGTELPVVPPQAGAASTPVAAPPRFEWMSALLTAERIAPLALLALLLYWQRRRPQVLARRFVATLTPGREVDLKAARRLLFAPGSLSHHFQALRRHHVMPSGQIDVARSLRATVRAGGAVRLQFATQRRLPEYLVLVDRVSLADHEGALADVVLRRFIEEQVAYSAYDFHGDPRRLRARGAGSTAKGVVDLADLAALHGEHPLMLFTEAERFFVDNGEQSHAWVDQLLAWPLTVILTPKPRAEWSVRERHLQSMGFVVLPATPAGIAGIAELLNAGTGETAPLATATAEPPLALLGVRADRWLRQTAPSQREIAALLEALPAGLGAAAFELLCAIAVFPAVNAEVTLWLASALARQGAPLLDEESFGRLARLPWLRRGRMPDWLRLTLIGRLGAAREAEIRLLCLHLLKPRVAGESFELEIAVGSQRTWLATLLAALRQDEDSPLHDTIFLSFVRHEKLSPLLLLAPSELGRLLRPPRLGALDWLAVAATALAMGLLWRYDLAIGTLLTRTAEWASARLQLSDELRLQLSVATTSLVLGALALWHWTARLHTALAAPRLLRAARWTAALAGGLAQLVTMGGGGWSGLGLLGATAVALRICWLPPFVPEVSASIVKLTDLTQRGGWVGTSFSVVGWLGLFLIGQGAILEMLFGPTPVVGLVDWPWLMALAFAAPVALGSAAVVAGRQIGVNTLVALRCGGMAVVGAAFCLALGVPALRLSAPPTPELLNLPVLLAAGWGAMLELWRHGRARARWVANLLWMVVASLAIVATLSFVSLLIDASPETSFIGRRLSVIVAMQLVLALFAGTSRGLTGARPWWRLPLASSLLLILPLAGSIDEAVDPGAVPFTQGAEVWLSMFLFVPALRIAAPERFRAAAPRTPEPGHSPPGYAWALLPLLWLLASSYSFGPVSFPLGTYLFVPLSAWWANRFGRAGWPSFIAGASPLLIGYFAGPLHIGGAASVFVVSWIVFKLVVDPDYRRATFDASLFGRRQLLYLMLVAAITVYVPGSGGPISIGGSGQAYFILLLLLLGLSGIAPPALSWALVPGLALGIALRWLPSPRSAFPLFDLVDIGYSINDPSVLVGALLALYGPAYLQRRADASTLSAAAFEARLSNAAASERATALSAGNTARSGWGLVYLLLAYGFVDVYFGLSVDLASRRLSVSLVGTSGLLVVAFLVGLHDGRRALARVGWMLVVLVAIAFVIEAEVGGANGPRGVTGFGLRYSVNALEIAQGALVVAAYLWLGVKVAAHAGMSISLQQAVSAAAPVPPLPATLAQLRFAYMDIVLTVGAAVLLGLRIGLPLYAWLAQGAAAIGK